MSWRDKIFLVVGLARSGCAAGALLRRHGAIVIGVDDASGSVLAERWRADQLETLAANAFDEVHAAGDWSAATRRQLDGIVLSPGVPLSHPELRALQGRVPILGELEWAARFCAAPIIAITGTNGKTTTTELTAHLARAAGRSAEALGNVGRPLSLRVEELSAESLAVVEVSSFQLETITSFAPSVGVVLNLAPDHLDRYPDLAAYYRAKRRLADSLSATGQLVTWTRCAEARAWPTTAQRVLFGDLDEGADVGYADGQLHAQFAGRSQPLLRTSEIGLQSAPNHLNAAAAVAALLPFALDPTALAEGLRTYEGLPHRHQLVASLGEVRFVDDSKGTNVAAVCAGLASYAGPVVLILGGRGKGEDYGSLRDALDPVRAVVVLGEEGPALSAALAGRVPVTMAADLDEAVAQAARLAAPQGTVLLSPACASFDMFRDYHHRGEAFAAAACALGAVRGGSS